MTFELPPVAHNAQTINWSLKAQMQMGPPSISGYSQRARLDGGAGMWMATLPDISIRSRQDFAQWGALESLLDGGVETVIVPRCEPLKVPWPRINGVPLIAYSLPHDDDTPHDDDAPYAQPVIDASAGAAASGATSMTITVAASGQFLGGEVFSINHPTAGWRMYQIARITAVTGNLVSGTSGLLAGTLTVQFRPPLWEAVTSGTAVEFDSPRCTMQLKSPDDFGGEVRLRKFGTGSLVFIEAPVAR